MICPICKTRFANYPEEDYIIDDNGIIPKNDRAYWRRMRVFDSDEKQFCSEECSECFLEECEAKQLERELGFDRRMKEGWFKYVRPERRGIYF